MKRCILLIVALSAWVFTASASPVGMDEKGVQVTGIEVGLADHTVTVFFTLHTGHKLTPANRSLVIRPVLRQQGHAKELPPIVVRGARARTSGAAQALGAGEPVYTENGKSVDYLAAFPYESWMAGSELFFKGVNVGRGKSVEVVIGLVADNLLNAESAAPVGRPAPVTAQQITTPNQPGPLTASTSGTVAFRSTGEELAARFSFVEPTSAFERAQSTSREELFDYNMPLTLGTGTAQKQNETERFIAMTREGALTIQFPAGSHTISRDYGSNNRALVDLVSAVRAIESSSTSRIARIVIVEFVSAEGTLNENEKLSMDRARVTKEFLTANSAVRADMIQVYNGSVDWSTLRELVAESDMADKYTILGILDNTPVWDSSRNRGRLDELMAVNNGEPYRYMLE
ncbi:MAG: hypothetical protein LUD68_04190, partial [Rikenellaceae bacterium]|nr:hypothetical protein [Rikenellaceae bacterium]